MTPTVSTPYFSLARSKYQAARGLQRLYRGHQVRSQIAHENRAASKIQRVFRKWSSLKKDDCAICMSPLRNRSARNVTSGECEHTFHKECIQQWINEQNRCPLCNRENPFPELTPQRPAPHLSEDFRQQIQLLLQREAEAAQNRPTMDELSPAERRMIQDRRDLIEPNFGNPNQLSQSEYELILVSRRRALAARDREANKNYYWKVASIFSGVAISLCGLYLFSERADQPVAKALTAISAAAGVGVLAYFGRII